MGISLTADRNQPWGHVEKKKDVQAVDLDEAWQVPTYLLPAGGLAMSASDTAGFCE